MIKYRYAIADMNEVDAYFNFGSHDAGDLEDLLAKDDVDFVNPYFFEAENDEQALDKAHAWAWRNDFTHSDTISRLKRLP